jgi:hypothetical protein
MTEAIEVNRQQEAIDYLTELIYAYDQDKDQSTILEMHNFVRHLPILLK